jgi:hypothetical protein
VVAKRNLPIGGHDHVAVAADTNNGGGANAGLFFLCHALVQNQLKTSSSSASRGRKTPWDATLSIGHLDDGPCARRGLPMAAAMERLVTAAQRAWRIL